MKLYSVIGVIVLHVGLVQAHKKIHTHHLDPPYRTTTHTQTRHNYSKHPAATNTHTPPPWHSYMVNTAKSDVQTVCNQTWPQNEHKTYVWLAVCVQMVTKHLRGACGVIVMSWGCRSGQKGRGG